MKDKIQNQNIKISRTTLTLEYLEIGEYVIDIFNNRIGIVKKIKFKEKHNGYVKVNFIYYVFFEGIKHESVKYYNLEDLRKIIISYK